jgi:hypothetical protein
VAGHDVWADPVGAKARCGVLPEGLRLFERLSGRELLGFTGRLRGLPGAEADGRADELLRAGLGRSPGRGRARPRRRVALGALLAWIGRLLAARQLVARLPELLVAVTPDRT